MSAYRSFETIKNIGVIGTGTIGASWATYFLSRGFKVKAWDPGDEWQDRILDFINEEQIEIAHKFGLIIMMHLAKKDAIADDDNINDGNAQLIIPLENLIVMPN